MNTIRNSLFAIALFIYGASTYAQGWKPIDENKVANGGYDLVAIFHRQCSCQGIKNLRTEINGVEISICFGRTQKLIQINPEKYLPVMRWLLCVGVAEKGKKVPVNPQTFKNNWRQTLSFLNAVQWGRSTRCLNG